MENSSVSQFAGSRVKSLLTEKTEHYKQIKKDKLRLPIIQSVMCLDIPKIELAYSQFERAEKDESR